MGQQIHLDTNVINLGYFIQGSINTVEIPVHNSGQNSLEIKVKGNFRCWCEEKIIPKQSTGIIKCSIDDYVGPFRRVHFINSNSIKDSTLNFYISGISFRDSLDLLSHQKKIAQDKQKLLNDSLGGVNNQISDSIDLSLQSKTILYTPKTRKRFYYMVTEYYNVLDEKFPSGYKCNGYNEFSTFFDGANLIIEGYFENCFFKNGKVYLYNSLDSLVRVNHYKNTLLTQTDSIFGFDTQSLRLKFRNINEPLPPPKLKTRFTGKVEIIRGDRISSGCGSALLITTETRYYIHSKKIDFETYEGKTVTVYGDKHEAVEGNVLCIEVKKITTANKK